MFESIIKKIPEFDDVSSPVFFIENFLRNDFLISHVSGASDSRRRQISTGGTPTKRSDFADGVCPRRWHLIDDNSRFASRLPEAIHGGTAGCEGGKQP